MRKVVSGLVMVAMVFSLVSCAGMENRQQKGTAVGAGTGAAVGAILGQVIGGDTKGTLIGAGIGAALGGIAGNQVGRYMDAQEQELQYAIASSEAASLQREEEILRATFKGEAFFDFDSSTLKPGAIPEIARIARVLNKYPQTTLEIGGHTDTTGSAQYNQVLSEKRALAVRDELAKNGVAYQRMQVVGYGMTRPVSSNDADNRRVEIIIKPIVQG